MYPICNYIRQGSQEWSDAYIYQPKKMRELSEPGRGGIVETHLTCGTSVGSTFLLIILGGYKEKMNIVVSTK